MKTKKDFLLMGVLVVVALLIGIFGTSPREKKDVVFNDEFGSILSSQNTTDEITLSSLITLGENDNFIATIEHAGDVGENADITLTEKTTGVTVVLPMHATSGVVIQNNTKKDMVLLSFGTSSIRSDEVYTFPQGEMIDSFCEAYNAVFSGDRIVYSDCTENQKLGELRSWVENGERNPNTYIRDPRTGTQTLILASDMLHKYFVQTADATSVTLYYESVQKVEDWADMDKITESEETRKLP